jgi:hypothetical protein
MDAKGRMEAHRRHRPREMKALKNPPFSKIPDREDHDVYVVFTLKERVRVWFYLPTGASDEAVLQRLQDLLDQQARRIEATGNQQT